MPPLHATPPLFDDNGRTRSVVLTSVGSDWVAQVPDGFAWDFLWLDAQLSTSAAVANRQLLVTFDDGANKQWSAQAPVQAASLVINYHLAQALPKDTTDAARIYLPGPSECWMYAGWRVFATTALLDVADKWQVAVMVREYLLNRVGGPRDASRYASGSTMNRFAAPRRPGRAY